MPDIINGRRESCSDHSDRTDKLSCGVVGAEKDFDSSSTSSSLLLFPARLSFWMTVSPPSPNHSKTNDDESLYHDCLSSFSSSVEGETASLLSKTAQHHDIMASHSLLSPSRQYNAPSTNPFVNRNSIQEKRSNDDVSIANDTGTAAPGKSNFNGSIPSPFAQALDTWLSPYAEAAKRAGRRMFHFSEDSRIDEKAEAGAGEKSNYSYLLGKNSSAKCGTEGTKGKYCTAKFHPDFEYPDNKENQRKKKSRLGLPNRARSSPSLTTTLSDEKWNSAEEAIRRSGHNRSIVLRDIDAQGENNDSEDGMAIHPWTKLILLEELGTAWSWFVLLVPYLFMFIAVILDGDTTLKKTSLTLLDGNRTCADLVQHPAQTPRDDLSVREYFPVPFQFADGNDSGPDSTVGTGSCTYPFELPESVGLLSHRESADSNSTVSLSSSISTVDARYRYLMSHGHALTGVIPNVPPTSQSLRSYVKFDHLSSNAVALVARGSVLISAIVFQRQTPNTIHRTVGHDHDVVYTNPSMKQWSPLLILSSKRLDMICKLNDRQSNEEKEYEASTWNCSSRGIIDVFFSLPNTAVLMGGDLRVDILLSHHKAHCSFSKHILFNERDGVMDADDDYTAQDFNSPFVLSEAEMILSEADVSHPQDLLAEISTKSLYKLEHQSIAFNNLVEATRIFSLSVTVMFLCYWVWSMGIMTEDSESRTGDGEDTSGTRGGIQSGVYKLIHMLSCSCKRINWHNRFWWEDPWAIFPERRYLLLLLCFLITLQNPLLVYAFFHPSLYSSSCFRFSADSLSGISIHGILFLWLCLVHGLRYHTADIARRRFNRHRRVLELRRATRHILPNNEIEDSQWGRVRWYYQQYGDVDGDSSLALRLKHDINSDSFVEFMFLKIILLAIGMMASVTVAASRFPMSERRVEEGADLNPYQFGSGSKAYIISSVLQLIIVHIWGIFIVYTSFITGERLRREPFLSTRPAQLAFRVLSSILLLGVLFSILLLYVHSRSLIHNNDDASYGLSENVVLYDTSLGGGGGSWDSKADILFGTIHHIRQEIPYMSTASNIGPGKILYATACSLVVAQIFLPSSHFHPSETEQRNSKMEDWAMGANQYSRQILLSDMDKKSQGKDKRVVVALARNTHTWRIFPLPTRSHGLMSQHTLKETLNIVGTFQLNGNFSVHKLKIGRGAIYKGRYNPVFCVEIACWLLEASWQAYYSLEYSLNNWAPGRMRLDSIGLKLEHAINDSMTDTHAFVASNISEQVEGEEDSIIVIAFRGSASIFNVKTDLSFRQVPLPGEIASDTPAFNIQPEMPITVGKTIWDTNETSPMIQNLTRQTLRKYQTWPSTTLESTHVDPVDIAQSHLIPTVSNSAKAIIRATPMARQALPCVHEGFLENYSNVRHEITGAIISILKRQLDKSVDRCRHGGSSGSRNSQPLTLPKLYITGHSMGGAIAQLLALDLASNVEIVIDQPLPNSEEGPYAVNDEDHSRQSLSSLESDGKDAEELPDIGNTYWFGQKLKHQSTLTKKIRLRPPIAVYTYGQPRVGNSAFKAIYKKRVPHTFRVATEGDAITSLLTVGPFCGGIYRHAGLEVLLEEGCTGNILVGPTVVETLLRFTKVRTSMAAHSMDRYRESLESALGREDLKEYYRGHGGKVRHDSQGVNSGNDAALPSWVTSVRRSHDV